MFANLPPLFVSCMTQQLGLDESVRFFEALAAPPVTSIRLNPDKCGRVSRLRLPSDAVPWCASGRYLPERPQFTFDPLLHGGAYYVQEPSSMFVEQAVRSIDTAEPLRVLDLCAAPGGKTTLLRSLLPKGSLLVANEPVPMRSRILRENVQKWGHPDCVVTQDLPADFASLEGFFDLILADVPCSGEGMFRKDENSIGEWSLKAVTHCAGRQRDILAAVWPALKPGGHLIYSTCTYNMQEDEDNVEWICRTLGARMVEMDVPDTWGAAVLRTDKGERPLGYHFFPHRLRGEGFFLSLMRKAGRTATVRTGRKKKLKSQNRQCSVPNSLKEWIEDADNAEFLCVDDKLIAINKAWKNAYVQLADRLNVLSAGTLLATEKEHGIVPEAALALSMSLKPGVFPAADLPYGFAVAFLRGEAVMLPSDAPRGLVLVTYRGLPLGFVKNLGMRANNLYPAEWRIKSGYVPSEFGVI